MKQSGLWSSLDTHGSLVVIWWLCISSSGETRKFDFLSQIWPWRSKSIRTFGNRCLSAIGGGNRWSRFAGWVQLSAEAAWPPRSTVSANLCAQATMQLMWPCNDMVFGLQYDFLNHNDVLIIGTYFFLRRGSRKNYHRYQNGIKKTNRCLNFECLYYISIDLDQMITS